METVEINMIIHLVQYFKTLKIIILKFLLQAFLELNTLSFCRTYHSFE